jgi:hypothetical protein
MRLLLPLQKISCGYQVLLFAIAAGCFCLAEAKIEKGKKNHLRDIIQEKDSEDEYSIWESEPVEIYSARVQILDKISGKVYREVIEHNTAKIFGSIEIKLKRCFKNGPEDNREVAAFVEISEKDKIIFSNWLFASAPSVNLFAHPVYDVRVEF